MKLIDCSTKTFRGVFAKVDDLDFDVLSQWKWTPDVRKRRTYLFRQFKSASGKYVTVRMHEQILGKVAGAEIDHRDGDGLNNQRANIRHCTTKENQRNRHFGYGTSLFKGVHRDRDDRFIVAIVVDSKRRHVAVCRDERSAAVAYNEAAKKYFGEFARLNIID